MSLQRHSRYWTIWDGINYCTFFFIIYERENASEAHDLACAAIKSVEIPQNRIRNYKFASTPLQRNPENIRRTDTLYMATVERAVKDYYNNRERYNRVAAFRNLWTMGNYRDAAEKIYCEQFGPRSPFFCNEPISFRRARSDSNEGRHVRSPVPTIERTEQETDGHGRSSRATSSAPSTETAPCPLPLGMRLSPQVPRVSTSATTSPKSTFDAGHPAQSNLPLSQRIAPRGTEHVVTPSDIEQQQQQQQERTVPSYQDQRHGVTLPENVPTGPSNKRRRISAKEPDLQQKNDTLRAWVRETAPDRAATTEVVTPTLPVESEISQAPTPRCETPPHESDIDAVVDPSFEPNASDFISSSDEDDLDAMILDDSDDDIVLSEHLSRDPPVKIQPELATLKDFEECIFCGEFYSRVKGGAILQHRRYWCVKNPNRRDINKDFIRRGELQKRKFQHNQKLIKRKKKERPASKQGTRPPTRKKPAAKGFVPLSGGLNISLCSTTDDADEGTQDPESQQVPVEVAQTPQQIAAEQPETPPLVPDEFQHSVPQVPAERLETPQQVSAESLQTTPQVPAELLKSLEHILNHSTSVRPTDEVARDADRAEAVVDPPEDSTKEVQGFVTAEDESEVGSTEAIEVQQCDQPDAEIISNLPSSAYSAKMQPNDWELLSMYCTATGVDSQAKIDIINETLDSLDVIDIPIGSGRPSSRLRHARMLFRELIHSEVQRLKVEDSNFSTEIVLADLVLLYLELFKDTEITSRDFDAPLFEEMISDVEKRCVHNQVLCNYLGLFYTGTKLQAWQFLHKQSMSLLRRYRLLTDRPERDVDRT